MENSLGSYWFPGRWLGGLSLVMAPLMILAGILTRIPFHFFFPDQLKAFESHSTLITTAYALFVLGNMLLAFAIITMVQEIGLKKPMWATAGGAMVLLGLFTRTFHGGVDHLAFQLVPQQGVERATKTIADAYGAYYAPSIFVPLILTGWIVLAIGAYLSGTLGLIRSICLALMSGLMIGVLKGSSLMSVIAVTGLCVALVPLGFHILSRGPKPGIGKIVLGTSITIVVIVLLYFVGQAG